MKKACERKRFRMSGHGLSRPRSTGCGGGRGAFQLGWSVATDEPESLAVEVVGHGLRVIGENLLDELHEALDVAPRDHQGRRRTAVEVELDEHLLAQEAHVPDHCGFDRALGGRCCAVEPAQLVEQADGECPALLLVLVLEVVEDAHCEVERLECVEVQLGAHGCGEVSSAGDHACCRLGVLGSHWFRSLPRLMRLLYYTLNYYFCQYAYDKK